MKWLNRNVLGIGLADLAADANYEMVFAVLPLFITVGLGAPAFAVGVIEGVGDGSSAIVKLWSGWYSDRIAWRRPLAVAGYGTTVFGLGLMVAVASWPQVVTDRSGGGLCAALDRSRLPHHLLGRACAGRSLRNPVRPHNP
ncbi:MAG: MFS transporter [Chloroflexi bacterium]|nr:MAG: MFS transporter [Chloroflexota bacterium]